MTQHTPGPWKWVRARTQYHLHSENGGNFAQVTMPVPEHHYKHFSDNAARERMKANARLIAAAPDLLDALENLGLAIERGCPQQISDKWLNAVDAIRKAKGE